MRRLTRPEPPDWYQDFYDKGMKQLSAMAAEAGEQGISSSYFSDIRLYTAGRQNSEIKQVFLHSSSGTCHACESLRQQSTLQMALEQYRPKHFASNRLKKQRNPHHYWWLTYSWDNFQILCVRCNRNKATIFPIKGKRAELMTTGNALITEEPLLLNPFDDQPTKHLVLDEKGQLHSLTERGAETIGIYRLNRSDLVEARNELYQNVKSELTKRGWRNSSSEAEKSRRIEEFVAGWPRPRLGAVELALLSLIRVQQRRSVITQPSQWVKEAPSLVSDSAPLWLESVRLQNFCLFADFELKFHNPSSTLEPWLAVIGENGVGKSSLLKAIVLALSTETQARELVPDAREIFNRNTRRRKGFVEVKLSNGAIRRLNFTRNSKQFTAIGPEIAFPVIALGANRITTRKGSAKTLPTAGSLNNLFDPVLPLVDIEEWLTDTKAVSAQEFGQFAQNLKYLIDLGVGEDVARRSGRIYFKRGAARQDLAQMSDGFRSVVGLVAHIMKHLAKDTTLMSEAEGTVLLDEIESHLHPTWKIQIVEKLRKLYPKVRFIITTHDPLCLYGLEDKEAYLFRRNEAGDNIDLEPIPLDGGLDVDWLLTTMFGLNTTLDSDTEDMLHDYSTLALRRDLLRLREDRGLPEDELQEFEDLRNRLRRRLPGFAGTGGEADTLVDVARGRVMIEPDEQIDQNALASKIRDAFANKERGS